MSIKISYNQEEFLIGDTLRVNYKIREKDKERIQAFDGILIAIQGIGENKSIVIRKDATDGVKVERIIPINSPWIESIKKIKSPKKRIRRAKLYYLRDAKSKKI